MSQCVGSNMAEGFKGIVTISVLEAARGAQGDQ